MIKKIISNEQLLEVLIHFNLHQFICKYVNNYLSIRMQKYVSLRISTDSATITLLTRIPSSGVCLVTNLWPIILETKGGISLGLSKEEA